MTHQELKKAVSDGIIHAAAILAIVFLVSLLLGEWLDQYAPYDSTDNPPNRSGMEIHVDHLTGCEYLEGGLGGLTPRLNRNGKPMCGGNR